MRPTEGMGRSGAAATQIRPGQRTLRGQVYYHLRQELLAGRLRPGERVNEVAIATGLGISRGPLREAIRDLEQEGILVSVPHRGAFVPKITEEDVAELQEVRLALETTAACRFARRRDLEAMGRLESRLDDLRRMHVGNSTLAQRIGADLALHEAICEASGNETLVETWRSLIGRITIVLVNVGPQYLDRLQDAAAHEPLLAAIGTGQEATIREAYSHVFEEGTRVVLEALGHDRDAAIDPA
jgi:DNA-binding GntR family transcriptional regulator